MAWFNVVDGAYRSEFGELFEANFGRFEARLEQRSGMFVFWAARVATSIALIQLTR